MATLAERPRWARTVFSAPLIFLGLTACVTATPVNLASRYDPDNAPSYDVDQSLLPGGKPCRVVLADVRDVRADPHSAGDIVGRSINADEAPTWVRSGLLSMGRDPRLTLSDQPASEPNDLLIRADLLKVYMMPINAAKSANVVVRIRYVGARSGVDERLYRGVHTSIDWASGAGEAQGALDDALTKLIADIHRDVLSRCATELTANEKARAQP